MCVTELCNECNFFYWFMIQFSDVSYCEIFMLQEFDDTRDADDAVYDLNGKELLGDRCGF